MQQFSNPYGGYGAMNFMAQQRSPAMMAIMARSQGRPGMAPQHGGYGSYQPAAQMMQSSNNAAGISGMRGGQSVGGTATQAPQNSSPITQNAQQYGLSNNASNAMAMGNSASSNGAALGAIPNISNYSGGISGAGTAQQGGYASYAAAPQMQNAAQMGMGGQQAQQGQMQGSPAGANAIAGGSTGTPGGAGSGPMNSPGWLAIQQKLARGY